MCAHLELLTALLVDMGRPVHGELLDAGRQRDGPTHLGTGPFRRVHDLLGRRIEDAMVEGFEPDSYVLALHLDGLKFEERAPWQRAPQPPLLDDRRYDAGTNGAAALADGEA